MALLGGELRLESEPGRGSRFFFQLKIPLAAPGAENSTVARSVIGGWPTDKFGRKRTLLFIGLPVLQMLVIPFKADDGGWSIAPFVGRLLDPKI